MRPGREAVGRNFIVDELGPPVVLEVGGEERLVHRYIVTAFVPVADGLGNRLKTLAGEIARTTGKLREGLDGAWTEEVQRTVQGKIGFQAERDLISLISIVPFTLSPLSVAVTYYYTKIDDPPPHP